MVQEKNNGKSLACYVRKEQFSLVIKDCTLRRGMPYKLVRKHIQQLCRHYGEVGRLFSVTFCLLLFIKIFLLHVAVPILQHNRRLMIGSTQSAIRVEIQLETMEWLPSQSQGFNLHEFVKESGPEISEFLHVYGGIRSAEDYAPYQH